MNRDRLELLLNQIAVQSVQDEPEWTLPAWTQRVKTELMEEGQWQGFTPCPTPRLR